MVVAIWGYFLLQKIEINDHKLMLTNMIDEYIAIEKFVKTPEDIIKSIKHSTDVRVTIIKDDGKVLYESDRDIKGMQNHLNRPEIQQALSEGVGHSVRHSVSIDRDLLYVAKYDKNRFVRMAYKLDSIKDKFIKFWLKAMLLFAVAMALAFYLAIKLSKKISADLKKIKNSLDGILHKKYNVEFNDAKCCMEFETISQDIKKVAVKLKKREKQKQKYTKKLKTITKKQGDIISAISHEFKNPVAAIMGYAQTVKEDDGISRDMRVRFLQKVLNNANKISNMIDRLSLAMKLENENIALKKTTFLLKPLLLEVKEILLQKYKDREIVIESEDIEITVDKTMFENLLINLIENALKYSEDEVIIKATKERLEVIDKGIGIEKEDLKKLTDKFFRVDSLSWDNSIGVGLYIAKYILKLHGFELMIESQKGVGSKFWFELDG